MDANAIAISAFNLTQSSNLRLQQPLVLSGLGVVWVEEILRRSQTEDDGAIIRRLINRFMT
ncbi:hypothetical protein [Desertifilum sp. FACHB-866]|uniref:hypothetical protein n=1 Tax=Desertifilum sp. FACHB-866 TaxID=2692796 RepID=UPI001684F456|nr:hypothetical protein [Desertifilum sp. FACHB-866]